MSEKKLFGIFGIVLAIFTAGIITGVLLVDVGYIPLGSLEGEGEIILKQDEQVVVDAEIDYGNGDVQSFADVKLQKGATVLDALKQLEEEYNVPLETREFAGIGTFVEAIHGVHNTSAMYWQFWVNDEYSLKGAAQAEVRDGDRILWKRTDEKPNTK